MSLFSLDWLRTPRIAADMIASAHTHDSSLREQYIEYVFLAGLCRVMWRRGEAMDVLRSHTDRSGYDLLLEVDGVGRHVQLKASFHGATTRQQNINAKLAACPSGCVVWIWFDPTTLEQTKFLWLGSEPGQPLPPLPNKLGKHSKGNAQGIKADRSGARMINKGKFDTIIGFEALADKLFGRSLSTDTPC